MQDLLKKEIYFIGGSTCCGKSTITDILTSKYGFQYFKVDDFLNQFIIEMAKDGNRLAEETLNLPSDHLWLREPEILCTEEFDIYKDMFPYILKEMNKLKADTPIMAEGAAYLPELMQAHSIPKNRYICIAPTKEFQLDNYSKRPWIHEILKDTSDPKKAFSNWMERDALFAQKVLKDAETLGYKTLLVDGSKTIEENTVFIETVLELI